MADTGIEPEVIRGILTAASVDIVPSPAGRMKDMNTNTMWPRTHTPQYTVTHTQMLKRGGGHYTTGSH